MVRLKSFIFFIFFLSGVSALIYQVVWQRLLTLYYGVGAFSITIIVSVFMAGLGLGALLGGYCAERYENKIRFYLVVELLIGLFGLLSLPLLDILGRHTAGSDYGTAFLYISLFLLFPTVLMGMTLPLLTKILNRFISDFLQTVSSLYFINTLGAAFGALLASYGLISFWGLDSAVYFAVGINFILAVAIFVLLRKTESASRTAVSETSSSKVQKARFEGSWVYVCVLITGFLAIGYEIIWFRLVGVLIKGSPYAFSTMLCMYLLGIAWGSFWMGGYIQRNSQIDRRRLFFGLQFLLAFAVFSIVAFYFWTLKTPLGWFTQISFSVSDHPMFLVNPAFYTDFKQTVESIYIMLDVFLWPFIFMFAPTFLMGASFPLIASLTLQHREREGETVGHVYFFNIVGNVLGGLVTGFILLPFLGTEFTLKIFVIIGFLFGLFLQGKKKISAIAFVILTLIVLPQRGQLYLAMHPMLEEGSRYYFEEGMEGIVVTDYGQDDRVHNFISGVSHGGRPGHRFYAEAIQAMGYVPNLENVLIIGYGTGSTTEMVLKSPQVKKLTLVELNHTLMKNLKKIPLFVKLLDDPRLTLIIDDGRRFLLRTEERYDLVIIDPLRVQSAYSNNIYSTQFFQMIKHHLSDEGVFMVWMNEQLVMPKTVATVFENVHCYKRPDGSICVAAGHPLAPDEQKILSLLAHLSVPDRVATISSMSNLMADRDQILQFTQNSQINEDWKPVCEYYLGMVGRYLLAPHFR